MTDIPTRLKEAREAAGFATASEAAKAYGWTYPTYTGHENGHRGIKPHDMEKYAKAFQVSVGWLMTGRDNARSTKQKRNRAPSSVGGFSETDAIPFIAPTDTQRIQLTRLAQVIAPRAVRIEVFELQRHYPGLALLRGDLLIVDPTKVEAKAGQAVLSQVVNERNDTGRTVLRISTGSGIIAPCGESAASDDEVEASIGVIEATLRPGMR